MATLAEQVKEQKLFILNKTTYFGTIEDISEGVDARVEVTKAIKVTGLDNFGNVIKEWIVAYNSNKLKNPKVSGLFTLEVEDLDEDQIMIIDIVAAKATQIIKNSLQSIQNKEILSILY